MAVLGSNTLNHSDNLLIQRAGATKITVTSTGASVTGLLAGTAVVSSNTDTTAGRLLTTGAGPAQAFRRGNILGTVSQSSGVPTGAVMERGSNANGFYVRYANGMQVVWLTDRSVAVNSSSGQISTSASQSNTSPAAFSTTSNSGNISGTLSNLRWISAFLSDTTSVSWRGFSGTSQSSATFRPAIMGRWF